MRRRHLILALAVACSFSAASAAPVSVLNPGFEDLYFGSNLPPEYGGDVPAGAFPVGPPPFGWSAYYENGVPVNGAFIGVLNPGTAVDHAPNPAYFPAGSPEGDNAVLLYMDGDTGGDEFGVAQQLSETLQPNTKYTLSVQVGNIASGTALVEPFLSLGFYNLDGFPGYRIQLLAGGQLLAEDTGGVSPSEGVFEVATLQYISGSNPPQVGQPLVVRLVNRNEPDVPGVRGLEVDFDDVQLVASPVTAVPVSPTIIWMLGATLVAIAAVRSRLPV